MAVLLCVIALHYGIKHFSVIFVIAFLVFIHFLSPNAQAVGILAFLTLTISLLMFAGIDGCTSILSTKEHPHIELFIFATILLISEFVSDSILDGLFYNITSNTPVELVSQYTDIKLLFLDITSHVILGYFIVVAILFIHWLFSSIVSHLPKNP